MWTFNCDYLSLLENTEYEALPYIMPHISIGHILKKIKQTQLQNRMKNIDKWKTGKGFKRKYFKKSMRQLAKQAKTLEE